MLRSREACVDYMMPIGLHHIFAFDEHYGPEPDGYNPHLPLEWCPVYYHRANNDSIGFNRTHTGSNATSQYPEPYCSLYDDINTCPERYLLWFHRVPWTYRMKSGRTVLEDPAVAAVLDVGGFLLPLVEQGAWTPRDHHGNVIGLGFFL